VKTKNKVFSRAVRLVGRCWSPFP